MKLYEWNLKQLKEVVQFNNEIPKSAISKIDDAVGNWLNKATWQITLDDKNVDYYFCSVCSIFLNHRNVVEIKDKVWRDYAISSSTFYKDKNNIVLEFTIINTTK